MQSQNAECFRWAHIRHLNPQNKDPQRIKTPDKAFIQNIDYKGIEFPVTIKQINKIEKQNSININVFGSENKQPYPIYISKEKNGDCMNLLLITEETRTHYVLIKNFNKFMYNQTNTKKENTFACIVYNQEPIWRVQLPYSVCETAFSQVGLFLD